MSLEESIHRFKTEIHRQLNGSADPSLLASTVLEIVKALRAVEEQIVDSHLETLVPEVLQKNPPPILADKQLWSSILNYSCNRTGKAIKDPASGILCTVTSVSNATTPKGFFILQAKHRPNPKELFKTGAVSRINGELTVEIDPNANQRAFSRLRQKRDSSNPSDGRS